MTKLDTTFDQFGHNFDPTFCRIVPAAPIVTPAGQLATVTLAIDLVPGPKLPIGRGFPTKTREFPTLPCVFPSLLLCLQPAAGATVTARRGPVLITIAVLSRLESTTYALLVSVPTRREGDRPLTRGLLAGPTALPRSPCSFSLHHNRYGWPAPPGCHGCPCGWASITRLP